MLSTSRVNLSPTSSLHQHFSGLKNKELQKKKLNQKVTASETEDLDRNIEKRYDGAGGSHRIYRSGKSFIIKQVQNINKQTLHDKF
jgi:hypothetical protein